MLTFLLVICPSGVQLGPGLVPVLPTDGAGGAAFHRRIPEGLSLKKDKDIKQVIDQGALQLF